MSVRTRRVDEYDVFVANLEVWLREVPGKYVLIKGERVVGYYDTRFDALSAAKHKHKFRSFFVRQVRPIQSGLVNTVTIQQ